MSVVLLIDELSEALTHTEDSDDRRQGRRKQTHQSECLLSG